MNLGQVLKKNQLFYKLGKKVYNLYSIYIYTGASKELCGANCKI